MVVIMRRAMAAVLIASCMPTSVPPPIVPEKVLPPSVPTAAAAPPPGKGQVTIATVDEATRPALVEEVTGHVEGVAGDGSVIDAMTYAKVCPATPCVADLGLGEHTLRFTSLADPHDGGTATISVGDQPSAYRYAMGHNTDPTPALGLAAFTVGVNATVIGLVLVGLGDQRDHPNAPFGAADYAPAGLITAVAGAVLTGFGIHWLATRTGTTQPGAGVQWVP